MTGTLERKMSILELVDNIAQLNAELERASTPEEEDAISAEIVRMLSVDVPRKVDGVAWYCDRLDEKVKTMQRMVSDIQDGIAAVRARKKRMRFLAHRALAASGAEKLTGEHFTIGTRAGEPKIRIDEDALPDKFKTVTVSMPAPAWDELTEDIDIRRVFPAVSVRKEIDREEVKYYIDRDLPVQGVTVLPADDVLCITKNTRSRKEVNQEALLVTANENGS